MKGLGDSNAERNAHKDENIAAISLTYNYKEFIMKKIAYYQDICGSCVYKSAEYSVDTGEDVRICHGWNG
jgi:hypothetical protein